jgi:hydroxymethylbilane synthase
LTPTGGRVIRIATRASRLALWQAAAVADRLHAAGLRTETRTFTTTGDRSQHGPVTGDDSKRQFVKELEEALLADEADVAVHSAKDLPVELPDGLVVAGCLPREDPRDAIVLPRSLGSTSIDDTLGGLRRGATVGTGSVRRSAQLLALLPGVTFSPIRGNVDTRLAKLDRGSFDALVLACAGLRRLGFEDRISAPIPLDQCVPAPGQGIVALEIRSDDASVRAAVHAIHDEAAGRALTAERALVTTLGGGCQLPLGAIAEERNGQLHLMAVVVSIDGARRVAGSATGPTGDPDGLGRQLAGTLAADGARALLDEVG